MLTLTAKEHCEILGVSNYWSSSLLRSVAGYGNPRRYSLAGVLPTITSKYRRFCPDLLNACRDDGELYVGLSLVDAEKLTAWISKDPLHAERLRYCHNQFFLALAATVKSSSWFSDTESLRSLLCQSGPVLRYVITGDKAVLPYWPKFVTAFAVVHSVHGFEQDFALAA